MDDLGGTLHLLLGGLHVAVSDVVPDGARKQMRLLEHVPQIALKPDLGVVLDIFPVDEDVYKRQ